MNQRLNHFNNSNFFQEQYMFLKKVSQNPWRCDSIILRRAALLSSDCKSPENSWRPEESSVLTKKYLVKEMKAIQFSFTSTHSCYQEILRLNITFFRLT